MFNRLALIVLLAGVFVGAAAVAQQPKTAPSPPPPKPGTPEYTDIALKEYEKAHADYEALSAKPGADLKSLDAAYNAANAALRGAGSR